MAIQIDREERKIYAEKVLDLANIGTGALLFSQFLTRDEVSWLAAVGGIVILVVGYLISHFIFRGGERI